MRRTLILSLVALVIVLIAAVFMFGLLSPQNSGSSGTESSGGFFGSLFPFNFGGGSTTGDTTNGRDDTLLESARPVPTLRNVSQAPAAGGFFFTIASSDTASSTVGIRYIDRQTGHVYETAVTTLTGKRISNTTIPGIESSLWQDKNHFIIRYLDDASTIQTFAISLVDAEEEQSVNGAFLSSWARAALDPQRKSLLAVFETSSGSRVELAAANGTSGKTVFSSPIKSWVPLQSTSTLFLESAPAAGIDGFLYRLSGQALVRVIGNIPGLLATVNPSGRYVLYSTGDEAGKVDLFMYDTERGETYTSPLKTLATKCAFVADDTATVVCGVPQDFPKAAYPTDWLLSRVALSDDLWLVDPVGGVADLLAIPESEAGTAIDVIHPFVDDEGTYVGFTNKNDLSLWSLKLSL